MNHDVFISYATRNLDVAKDVCAALENEKIKCWMAPRDILSGTYYGEAIIDAIATTKLLVFIFSPDSNNSGYVMRELERAVSHNLSIVPFRIEKVKPSKKVEFFIAASHGIDAFPPPIDSHINHLVRDVKIFLDTSNHDIPAKEPDEPIQQHEIRADSDNPSLKRLTWLNRDSDNPGLVLHIYCKEDNKLLFSLKDNNGRELVPKETVNLAGNFINDIQHAYSTAPDKEGGGNRVAFERYGNILYRSILPYKIQGFFDTDQDNIVIATDNITLPWELFNNGKEFLSLHKKFTRLPDSFRWADSLFGKISSQSSAAGKVLIIADPEGTFKEGAAEAEALNSSFRKHNIACEILTGPDQCRYLNIMDKLKTSEYSIIHFIGNLCYLPGRQSSALVLADEQLLPAEEICSSFQGTPLVFLNTRHKIIEQSDNIEYPPDHAARNIRAIAQAFNHGGSSGRAIAVIGCMSDSDDWSLNSRFSQIFYNSLFHKDTTGKAMQSARLTLYQADSDPRIWSSYVLYGNPNLELCAATPLSQKELPDSSQRNTAETKEKSHSGSLSDGLPWSDDVRVALFGAISAMHAMNWSVLTTIQLLLGLTYLPNGILSRALSDKGLEANAARRELRKFLKNDRQPVDTTKFEISPNLRAILKSSRRLASVNNNKEVDEKHLLHALLNNINSGAILILNALKINLDKIRAAINIPYDSNENYKENNDMLHESSNKSSNESQDIRLFLKNGELNTEHFDDSAIDVLKNAIKAAINTKWSFVATPHVLLSMLSSDKSILAQRLKSLNIGNQLTDSFHNALLKSSKGDKIPLSSKQIAISENTRKLLKRSHKHSMSEGRAYITERDILEAILQDNDGSAIKMLRKLNINPSVLQSHGEI